MNRIISILPIIVFCGCTANKESYSTISEPEPISKIDSLKNVEVHLSVGGITLGDSIVKYDKSIFFEHTFSYYDPEKIYPPKTYYLGEAYRKHSGEANLLIDVDYQRQVIPIIYWTYVHEEAPDAFQAFLNKYGEENAQKLGYYEYLWEFKNQSLHIKYNGSSSITAEYIDYYLHSLYMSYIDSVKTEYDNYLKKMRTVSTEDI